jgi:transcriptional regulator with XRE-family HTH domain
MARRSDPRAAVLTVPAYLAAVRSIHALGVTEVARALGVSASVVRRWLRGTLVPGWRRLERMTALWGGDARRLAVGAALQRLSRETGLGLDDAVRIIRSGRPALPPRRVRAAVRDRRQLSLPIARC